MTYPQLESRAAASGQVEQFYGLNKNIRIADGEFSETWNTSADYYPLLSSRSPRRDMGIAGVLALEVGEARVGAELKESFLTVVRSVGDEGAERFSLNITPMDGSAGRSVDICEYSEEMAERLQIVKRGGYAYVFPKGYEIDLLDRSQTEAVSLATSSMTDFKGDYISYYMTLRPCDKDGKTTAFGGAPGTMPENPQNGDRYTDGNTGKMYVYSLAAGGWIEQVDTHVLLDCDVTGKDGTIHPIGVVEYPFDYFNVGDVITVSGFGEGNGDGDYIIEKKIDKRGVTVSLVCSGFIDSIKTVTVSPSRNVYFSRRVPDMDYVVESGNRLWGCRYGREGTEVLNEIYCSALGDPYNWYKYENTSMDSWTASVGTPGAFTGAVVYGGYPIFFKEAAMIRVYGSMPSSYQLVTYNYRGVKRGSGKSTVIVDEVLYYHSYDGIVAYSGGLPQSVSEAFAREKFSGAVAGTYGGKYYVYMTNEAGEGYLYTYDTKRGIWHHEDGLAVRQMVRLRDRLFMLRSDGGVTEAYGGDEPDLHWHAETGTYGYSELYDKRLLTLRIRAAIPDGSGLSVWVRYDDGEWQRVGEIFGEGDGAFDSDVTETVYRPNTCDRFRLRFEGTGPGKIVAIYRETEYAGK